jgi:hypothetical protein
MEVQKAGLTEDQKVGRMEGQKADRKEGQKADRKEGQKAGRKADRKEVQKVGQTEGRTEGRTESLILEIQKAGQIWVQDLLLQQGEPEELQLVQSLEGVVSIQGLLPSWRK